MKNDKFQRAFTNIDHKLIERAGKTPVRYTKSKLITIIAAVLSISLCIGLFTWVGNKKEIPSQPKWIDEGIAEDYSLIDTSKYLLLKAEYPQMAKYSDGYDVWAEGRKERTAYVGDRSYLDSFIKLSISEFLSGRGELNSVYSPLSVYFTLAMMAEFEEGDGREQIFSLLGVDSIEELRKNSYDIWNANYSDEGTVTRIIASSLWYDDDMVVDEDKLKVLRDTYYSSVYNGDFASEDLELAFRAWLNENTGGLVDRLSDVSLDDNGKMVLASTVMFGARWMDEFMPKYNTEGIFHSPNGDISCEFMNAEKTMEYYYGDKFSAITKEFDVSGKMWFILPDENISVEELLNNKEFLSFVIIDGEDWSKYKSGVKVNMSMPKFDIQSDMDLTEPLKSLGLTELSSDFSGCRHGAGISVDEEGVKASAFTLSYYGAGVPEDEVDFILDRPFVFIIEGRDGLPLFVGVVNNP